MKKPALVAAALLTISPAGLLFIHEQESGNKIHTEAYLDPIKRATICDGITRGVTLGMRVTPTKCQILLKEETSRSGKAVGRLVKVPLSQGQYDMLIDFTHNLGEGALASSTMLKRINSGQCLAAGQEMLRWNKAKKNGKMIVLNGLTIRRQKEKTIWDADCIYWK